MSKGNYLIAIAFAIIFLITCGEENEFTGKLNNQVPGDSTVYIDSTFTVDFEANVKKISGFGCHVIYDSTQIRYISSQKYNNFDHEGIDLMNGKQGRLIIGFNQFDCNNAIQNKVITVFSITFHVKLTASEGISPIRFENKDVKLCLDTIPSQWHGLDLFISQLNNFVLTMKLRAGAN